MEEIIGLLALVWIGFADKMLNPRTPRPKRVLFFLLFYIPLAAALIWGASVAYERIGWFFSCILCAVMLFLLFFLGEKTWFASREKERIAFEKMRMRTMRFWVKYKNRLFNKKNKLPVRIFFFVLMLLPFYVIPMLIKLLMSSMSALVTVYLFATAFLTVVAAVLVFSGKKE